MAKLDPAGVGQALNRAEKERSRGVARLAQRLYAQRTLRPGLTADGAAALIWMLGSFDAYNVLAAGQAIPAEKVSGLLVDAAEHALLIDQ